MVLLMTLDWVAVSVGDGCSVGPGSVLEAGCGLGAGCRLHANVSLGHGVRLGRRVIVHPGAVIGAASGFVFGRLHFLAEHDLHGSFGTHHRDFG